MFFMIFLFILIIALVVLLIVNVKIVPQSYAYVIERIGQYHATWESGFHIAIPILDRISKKISLKEQVIDFPPQPVITQDNVTMSIDTVVYLYIIEPKAYVYGVENPHMAIENLTATTLRNIIGDMELDQTLTSRDVINSKMRAILDEATDPWGIKINRVELKNIMPPKEIQDSMERQMKAERERREAILRAEGEKKSSVLLAEGRKEALILDAQAEKEAAILRGEAVKETRVREAEGEAQAILTVKKAEAQGISYINAAKPTENVLILKGYEALEKVADGRATKLIIPSEIQNMAALLASAKAVVEEDPSPSENK
ncbi:MULTISPECIES: SPFH domain-containing protein [Eubacterium]|uniref:Regulator of protease activity HflC, stomatin/prohibitin superfamily n=1 Tax=Eubacterium barkeri TaxID=1528 RepID=A0A1H3H937_EUBBA|nr:SPFH domain-containing protein [Eubacterium barkeri]SDY12103.1 Regulator of protease activity HflC, stomatin/prohibitin superfamily [Eubacterium barkeri]